MPARAWPHGTLRLTFAGEGVIDLDFVTLESRTTYRGLKHFRPDLVEALADLKPRFMRFPGGCITHGLGMDNMYHWDRTIGPVEHRPHNFNLWGYHQSFRIGYYEYLCLCETIGAEAAAGAARRRELPKHQPRPGAGGAGGYARLHR